MSLPQAALVLPQAAYKDSFIAGVREYIAEGQMGFWDPSVLDARFGEYLQTLRDKETHPLEGMVPSTRFWLIAAGGIYAGELDLRHYLHEKLRRFGGHIGYTIVPSQRRQGYGTLICKLGIVEARARGIGDILITCDDDNIGSRKIIEANGGLLQDKIDAGQGVLTRRYWLRAQGSVSQSQSSPDNR